MRTLLVALALTGCSSPAMNQGSPDLSTGGSDLGAGYYLPSGFTMTPFLSTDPVRSFTAAGMATDPAKHYAAVMETDAGRLVIDLEDQTPITTNSFVWLTLHHFYDGLAFHRVIDGFVAQGGDPNTLDPDMTNWGTGDPGYSFGLEIVASLTYDSAGVVGMARTSDPNSNGSQFYITLAAAHSLDGMYTIFGHVTEGLDVLPNIVRGEPPAMPTRMQTVYIVEHAR
jgi:cyclophilin family peptidyl-prolyl cis-trans isomerase